MAITPHVVLAFAYKTRVRRVDLELLQVPKFGGV